MKKIVLLILLAMLIPAASASVVEYNSSLVLLLHANQTPATPTYFNDSSTKGHIFTAAGGAATNTSQKKFGNASGFFDGVGDYIKGDGSTDFAFGTGNFTVVFWMYRIGTGATQILYDHRTAATSVTPVIYLSSINNLTYYVNGSNRITGTYTVPATTWVQVALIRDAGNTKMYINGVQNGSTYADTNNYVVNASGPMLAVDASLGTSGYFVGHIDEVAVWKGVAVPITDLYPQSIEFNTTSPSDFIPVAAFTSSKNPSFVNENITFTDTSTNTPTSWNISFDNRTTWDNSSSPPWYHNFTSIGAYNVTLVCNNTFGVSNTYDLTQVVTSASGYTPQDVWMEGQYNITVHVTDSNSGAPLSGVSVTSSDGQSNTTNSYGYSYITEPFGVYAFYFTKDGYTSKSVSVIVDEDDVLDVQMKESESGGTYNTYPPKDVKFHITSFFGAPISGASVSILGVTTSTGNWDWLVTLLGIPLDEVAINGTAMTETTDSNGDAVFLMVPSVKYNITVSATGYTFPTTIIAPQATEYTIAANWNESWFTSGNDTLGEVNVSVSWVKLNDTYSFMNITYDDQTATTTGGTIYVYRDLPGRASNTSAITTMAITGSSCSNSTLLNTPIGGASYRVQVNATTTDQNIVRTFTHYFKGAPVTIPGFSSQNLLWLSLFVVIFTAAFAGAIHSPQMSIILCVEMWVFWAIGWLNALIDEFNYGETVLLGIMTLVTFLAILWNVTEGKAKGKRSS